MLQLPITIRIPLPHEMPHRDDIELLLAQRAKAKIEEGYKLTGNNNPRLNWSFMAEININNSHLWQLVTALVNIMPDELYCEYAMGDEETTSTGYYNSGELLRMLSPFQQELTQDATLQFSLVANQPGMLTELVVTACKYIRFTGNNPESFKNIMADFRLRAMADLSFTDEFPWITEPLKQFIPASRRPGDVIWSLNRMFGIDNI